MCNIYRSAKQQQTSTLVAPGRPVNLICGNPFLAKWDGYGRFKGVWNFIDFDCKVSTDQSDLLQNHNCNPLHPDPPSGSLKQISSKKTLS